MNRKTILMVVLPAWIALQAAVLLSSVCVFGQTNVGDIRGVTASASGLPLPEVQVAMHNVEENADRTIISAADGSFAFENLKPGRYQLTARKEGFGSPPAATVELGAGQSLRNDITLSSLNPSRTWSKPASLTVSENSDRTPLTEREKQLLERIDRLEQRLAALEAKEAGRANPATVLNQSASMLARAEGQIAVATQPAPASPERIAPQPSAPAHPVLVAALDPITTSVPAANAAALSIAPVPSSSVAAPPAGVSLPGKSPASTAQEASPDKKKIDPFSDWDWTWLNGNPRTKNIYWDTKFFTPEIRADLNYNWQNHHPADHSLGGSSEIFREGEVQMEQLGIGGDFHWDNVRARFMTQYGMYSETTPRNDASPANGEWNLDTAYRYLSEAYGGYHFNVMNGLNVDAGIFLSYIGLFSYYNFDNWAYQPSYVSSNTPWFFNGVRIQFFPTAHLKIAPWFINGWQSYASANNRPGLGGQIKWTPYPWMNIIFNNYGLGNDDLYAPGRARLHTDDSIEIKYYDKPAHKGLDKMAFSFTGDLGCEYGAGVSCTGDHKGGPKQSFIGGMLYNRWWFDRDRFGLTLGGGEINNPGRYLVLLPPINGETAPSAAINSPYFTENPGDKFKAWDTSLTFDWMPKEYITFRVEGDYRHANVPYWSGRGGITPPPYSGVAGDVVNGNGYPTEYACNNGAPSGQTVLAAAQTACGNLGSTVWFPNLVKNEFIIDFDILVKF